MQITCPECRSVLELEDSKAGRKVRCRVCGHKFIAVLPDISKKDAVVAPPAVAEDETPLEKLAEVSRRRTSRSAAMRKSEGPFVSPTGKASVALVLCLLTLILSGVVIWSNFSQIDLLHRIQKMHRIMERNHGLSEDELIEKLQAKGVFVTDEEAQANDERAGMIGLGFIAVSIIFFITYLVWKYRAYKNLYSLEAQQIRFSPGGAVGWYFCPILNLWRPYHVMNDIWQGSNSSNIGRATVGASALLMLWWAVWIVDVILSQVSFRLSVKAETIDAMIDAASLGTYCTIAGMASLLLTAVVIRTVSKNQDERHNNLQIAAATSEQEQTGTEL